MNNPLLEKRKVKDGDGVFAVTPITRGSVIIEFGGSHFSEQDMPRPYDAVKDHYMQVGPNDFLGPSGGLDDLINHSCDPNSGVVMRPVIHLVAIRDIAAGEEITWDYATTMDQRGIAIIDYWSMQCHCGSPICRHIVSDFFAIPSTRQEYYRQLGVVPDYVTGGNSRA